MKKKQKVESLRLKANGLTLETRSSKLKAKRTLWIIAWLLLSIQSYSQVLKLDSVLTVIDRQNPMLKEYDSKVKALNAYTEGAKSWMAPMVGVGTFMTPYPGQTLMEERDKG